MISRFWPLAFALLIFSGLAEAAVSVDNFRMPRADARGGGAGVTWRMAKDGEIDLSYSACPACRNPNYKGYRFTIDTAMARRIDELLPDAMIESATRAPCTLPHAEPGWALAVRVTHSDEKGNTAHRGFFLDCRSPELDTLRARITEAADMLLDEIARQGLSPETGL